MAQRMLIGSHLPCCSRADEAAGGCVRVLRTVRDSQQEQIRAERVRPWVASPVAVMASPIDLLVAGPYGVRCDYRFPGDGHRPRRSRV